MECKCFFARSIVKNLKYECLEDPDACGLLLNVKCKRCRLQKCLDMGMTQAARRLKKTSKISNITFIIKPKKSEFVFVRCRMQYFKPPYKKILLLFQFCIENSQEFGKT